MREQLLSRASFEVSNATLCLGQVLPILLIGSLTRESKAEIVHFRMTGNITVDYQVGDLPPGIYEGAPFRVDLSYDTATPDSKYPEEAHYADDPQRGLYTTDDVRSNFLRFRAGPSELSANDLWLWVGNDIDEGPTIENGRPSWELPDDTFRMLTTPFTSNFEFSVANRIVFHGGTRRGRQ